MLVPVHINTLELFVQLTCFLLLFSHIPVFFVCTLQASILDLHSGALSMGKQFVNIYRWESTSVFFICSSIDRHRNCVTNIDCSFLWMGKLSIEAKLCYIPGWKHFNMLIYGDWLRFGTADFGTSALASFYSPRHSVLMSTRFFQFVPQQEPPITSCAEI